jgi:WD40 repeat protein
MSPSRICPTCGAALPRDAPPGICPVCALRGALSAGAGEHDIEGPDEGTHPLAPRPAAAEQGPPLRPGQCVQRLGDYELLEEIARGGMGIVYRGRQISLDRSVALKLLPFSALTSIEFIKRFRAEASAAAALRHPNIVPVHEVGVHQGQHYLVMDFVRGPPLSRLVSEGPLPPQRAATYLKLIAEAVHDAHEHGILHRDLKPSNVLIDENDQPQVTDFGLAKRLDGESSLTLTGQPLGSPGYMPPEQAAGQHGKVTRRSDVYGLGAILYHLLAGRPPFQAGTLNEALQQVVEKDPLTPRLLNPSVPPDLQTICLKCLEKEPERRYPTAAALAEELGRFLRGEPTIARPIGPIARAWRWCRRKPLVAGLSAAVVLLLLVVGFGSSFAAWRLQRERHQTRAALREALWREALHVRRASGGPGQRFVTLDVLAKAAAIRPSLELRNEAIAALALPDLRELDQVSCPPGASLAFSASLDTYAQLVPGDPAQRSVSVHRAADHAELLRVPARSPGSPQFKLSPSGRFLVLCMPHEASFSRCQIWDVPAARLVVEAARTVRGYPVSFDAKEGVAVIGQPRGRLLVADLGARTTRAYDIGFSAAILGFHPEGRLLAAAALFATNLMILDLADGARSVARLPHSLPIYSDLDWSPDGRHLAVACGSGDTRCVVQVWAWEGGKAHPERPLQGHQASIVLVQYMPDGDLLWTHSYDGTDRLWSTHLGRQLLATPLQIAMRDLTTPRLAFNDTPTSYTRREVVTGDAHRLLVGRTAVTAPHCVAVSPDDAWVTAASADGVRLWHAATGRELAFLPGRASGAVFHPRDGSLVVAIDDQIIRWPLRRSAPGDTFTLGAPDVLDPPRPRGDNFHISCSADGRKLACVAGTQAEVIDWENPADRIVIPHNAAVSYVALSPRAAWAATCGGGPSKIWRLNPIEKVAERSRSGYAMAAFSPDGQWLVLSDRHLSSGVNGGRHQIYRVGSWEPVHEVSMDHGPWAAHAFSPDGRLLAVRVSRSAVRLLETGQWTEVATLEHPLQESAAWIAFSGDGALVAVAGGTHIVHLWDLRAVRKGLAEIGLDWDLPAYPPAATPASRAPDLVVVQSLAD